LRRRFDIQRLPDEIQRAVRLPVRQLDLRRHDQQVDVAWRFAQRAINRAPCRGDLPLGQLDSRLRHGCRNELRIGGQGARAPTQRAVQLAAPLQVRHVRQARENQRRVLAGTIARVRRLVRQRIGQNLLSLPEVRRGALSGIAHGFIIHDRRIAVAARQVVLRNQCANGQIVLADRIVVDSALNRVGDRRIDARVDFRGAELERTASGNAARKIRRCIGQDRRDLDGHRRRRRAARRRCQSQRGRGTWHTGRKGYHFAAVVAIQHTQNGQQRDQPDYGAHQRDRPHRIGHLAQPFRAALAIAPPAFLRPSDLQRIRALGRVVPQDIIERGLQAGELVLVEHRNASCPTGSAILDRLDHLDTQRAQPLDGVFVVRVQGEQLFETEPPFLVVPRYAAQPQPSGLVLRIELDCALKQLPGSFGLVVPGRSDALLKKLSRMFLRHRDSTLDYASIRPCAHCTTILSSLTIHDPALRTRRSG